VEATGEVRHCLRRDADQAAFAGFVVARPKRESCGAAVLLNINAHFNGIMHGSVPILSTRFELI
jgi:hypothetical protein